MGDRPVRIEPGHGLRAQILRPLTDGRVTVRPAAEPDAAFAENAASLRVLTSKGFRLEGTEGLAVLGRD